MPQVFFSRKIFFLLAGLLLILLLANPTFAQVASENNFLDPLLGQYADNAMRWESPLQHLALSIFWMLVCLDVVWVGMELILTKGDLGDWAIALIKQIIVIGFFYALLTNSSQWANAIIQSFRLAGDAANGAAGGTAAIQPSNVFDAGVNIAVTCLKSFKWEKPIDDLVIGFGVVIILISFALIAALQVVVLVESYIFTYAGIIFLGFGGTRFTRDLAQRYLFGIVAVGAKLFVIQLVIGLGVTMVRQWDADIAANQALLDIGLILRVAGGAIVFLALAKMIPDMVQGMLHGASYSSARPMLSATMAGASLGAAVANSGGAVFTGGLGRLTGAFGSNPVSDYLNQQSGNMADRAAGHANDVFPNAFDMNAGTFNQYMPGQSRADNLQGLPHSAFRGNEQGSDIKDKDKNKEENAIGGASR